MKFKKVKVSDQGDCLPIGLLEDGKLLKTFSFSDFTVGKERELAKIKAGKKLTISKDVTDILVLLADNIGGKNISSLGKVEKTFLINSLPPIDVMYFYIKIRMSQLGNLWKTPATCASCGHEFVFTGDLNNLEINTLESDSDYVDFKWVELEKGFKIRRDLFVKKVKLEMPKWNVMYNMDFEDTASSVKERLLLECIVNFEGYDKERIQLSEDEVGNISIRDSLMLEKEIDEIGGGIVDLYLDCECEKCKHKFITYLDWGFINFFGRSSLVT